MPPIISVNDLTHIYSAGTPFEHVAVDHVNFSAEPGELIGVIGHTGSGKSTLIQHLNALLKPTSGTVTFRGEDVWKDKKTTHAIRGKVGLVFQYPEYQLFASIARRASWVWSGSCWKNLPSTSPAARSAALPSRA